MRELIACWQHTRMIVLIGLCAALYAAVFFMFSWIPFIPGVTQFRPAASLPIVFSVFFGPIAAWGTAFGNILGDVISANISPGSLFGIPGNFIYGYVPYRIFRIYSKPEERRLSVLVFAIVLGSLLCAEIISLGAQAFGLPPFTVLANIILINNVVMSLILSPLMIRTLRARIEGMRITYTQILSPEDISRSLMGKSGPVILFIIALAVYIVMMVPSLSHMLPLNRPVLVASSAVLTIFSLLLL